MDERVPRYSFDPLERRGLLLGLRPVQIGIASGGLLVAWVTTRVLRSPAGPPLAFLAFVGSSGAAFWSKDGQSAASWLRWGVTWLLRNMNGPVLSPEPTDGLRKPRQSTPRGSGGRAFAGPTGIDLVELTAEAGQPPVGVLVDRSAGSWAAVVPVRGGSFSLLDPEEQARSLESWRVVLNSIGRPGTPVRRLQWVERTSPAGAAPLIERAEALSCARGEVDGYLEVVRTAATSWQTREVWLVLAVPGPARAGGPSGRRAGEIIRRELRLLEGQLRNAGMWTAGPLDAVALATVLEAAHTNRPATSRRSKLTRPFSPMAEAEGWSFVQADHACHATYWIAEWPRIQVGPDFMGPLLMGGERRATSLIMAPVPAVRAAREARSARTADVAEEHIRTNAGFTPSARRDKEAEGPVRREEELARGHVEYRFSGYITVSAPDREGLDLACAETEHAAQAAHLEIRRLYGRQREAFTWTLPLARGLR